MDLWLKFVIFLGTWLVFAALTLWAALTGHYLLNAPIGFLSGPVMVSVGMKLFTGRWPDWGGVWHLFKTRGRDI